MTDLTDDLSFFFVSFFVCFMLVLFTVISIEFSLLSYSVPGCQLQTVGTIAHSATRPQAGEKVLAHTLNWQDEPRLSALGLSFFL